MLDILLISDQSRLHSILGADVSSHGARLRIASSLDQGMEEIASKTPDILFLQNRLSGLAGYILVRHVREAAASRSTKIVLLTEGMQGSENSTADIELLTGVSDTELSDAISEIIGELPDHENPPHSSKEPADQAMFLNSTSPPPIQWEKKRVMLAVTFVAMLSSVGLIAVLLLRSGKGETSLKTAQVAPPLKDKSLTIISSSTRPPSRPLQQAVSSTAIKPAPLARNTPASLPSFMGPATEDSSFALNNPGWKRYTSSTQEYKIFREAGEIKAIQVLDRQTKGITPSFFSSAIREFANVRDYRTVSREVKGDFLVKKGRLSNSSEVILYKDRSDRILRAFVIHRSEQTTIPESRASK